MKDKDRIIRLAEVIKINGKYEVYKLIIEETPEKDTLYCFVTLGDEDKLINKTSYLHSEDE